MVDRTDLSIIEMLKNNSRISLSKMSEKLGISKTAVKKRMDKLKRTGIILGFSAKINESLLKCHKTAAIGVNIKKEKYFEVLNGLKKMEYIESIHGCAGSHDFYVHIRAPKNLLEKISKKINKINGVTSVCFNILEDRKR